MQKMIKKLSKSNQGFTLIALIVVIAILGILAAVLVPTVGNVVGTARQDAAKSDASTIFMAAQLYQTDALNGITTGTTALAAGDYTRTKGAATQPAGITTLEGSKYFSGIKGKDITYTVTIDSNQNVSKVSVTEGSVSDVTYP